MDKTYVIITGDGLCKCIRCGCKDIECNGSGDMPENCPGCGSAIDYSHLEDEILGDIFG